MIRLIEQLADDRQIFNYVLEGFRQGIAAGAFPQDRWAPTGGELCAYALFAHQPVGFATFYRPDEERPLVWLDLVWVAPRMRRRGFGRRLVARVVEACASDGIKTIRFGTDLDNAGMRLIGEHAGFVRDCVQYKLEVTGGNADA
jgi:GNAT superfamily N-acetyltransferase